MSSPVITALETTFTPPSACFKTLEAYTDRNTVLLVPLGITVVARSASAYYGCWPPGYQQFQASNGAADGQGYYSPGICPSGFTSACTVASANSQSGESAALCCPSNYGCVAGATGVYTGMSCQSTIVSTTVIAHYSPNLIAGEWQSDGMVTVPSGGTTLAMGYGIEVRWHSSDLSIFTEASRTGSSGSTPTPTPTGMSTGTSGSAPTSILLPSDTTASTAAPGMSSGTKLALGLGIPIVVILVGLIILASCLIRHRKSRDKHSSEDGKNPPDPESPIITPPAELPGDNSIVPPKAELNARTPSPVEIDGNRIPSPVFQVLSAGDGGLQPSGGDSGYNSPQGYYQHQASVGNLRVMDTYTISPVQPVQSGILIGTTNTNTNTRSSNAPPSSTNSSAHRLKRQSGFESSTVGPVVLPEDAAAAAPHKHKRTNSATTTSTTAAGGLSVRGSRHGHSSSGKKRRGSDARTASPIGSTTTGDGTGAYRAAPAVRRQSTDKSIDDRPPPTTVSSLLSRRGRSKSGSRAGSDVSAEPAASNPVARTPSAAVRRSSVDDRAAPPVPGVARQPAAPRATPESSAGTSEEEREIAERYRMFATLGTSP